VKNMYNEYLNINELSTRNNVGTSLVRSKEFRCLLFFFFFLVVVVVVVCFLWYVQHKDIEEFYKICKMLDGKQTRVLSLGA